MGDSPVVPGTHSHVLKMAAASYDPESDPWTVLRRNFTFAAEKICLCPELLRPMVGNGIISKDDYDELLMESIPKSRRKDSLLLDILPTRPPEMFPVFCELLRKARQDQLANRLEGIRRDRQSGNRGVEAEGNEQLRREKEELEA